MSKTITYPIIAVYILLVVYIFVNSTNYNQLAIGVLLYPVIAFLTLKVFPRRMESKPVITDTPAQTIKEVEEENEMAVEITDIDKRAFLKLVGATGLSFFLFSLLGRKANTFLPGATGGQGVTILEDTTGNKVDPAQIQPTDGFQISEIDDDEIAYYGFTNKDGAWLIMKEDTDSNSFRYAKGDAGFPDNWQKRKGISYDYFYNVY